MEKPTTLVVSSNRQKAVTEDGFISESNRLFVLRNGKHLHDFYKFRDLRRTNEIVLFEEFSNWFNKNPKLRKIVLPANINDAIKEYIKLQSQSKNKNIDCLAFCCLSVGIEIPKRDENDRRINDCMDGFQLANRKSITDGDIIFFFSNPENSESTYGFFRHAAIVINQKTGLCVSMYELEGELTFSTIEDIERDFKTNRTIIVERRF